MSVDYLADLSTMTPPSGLSSPQSALWWLAKGGFKKGPEWHQAHEIAQSREGQQDHDLVHALVHLIEGDTANAAYWYGRAGDSGGHDDPAEECARIAALLQTKA